MKPKVQLEDLISLMESRNANVNVGSAEKDVYQQLQEKENDLTLAAELGSALLEKNEELKRQIQTIVEDTGKKIEELEQEKHMCRVKLESAQDEWEAKVAELQTDVNQLKKTLDFREQCMKQMEREKSQLIDDLTAQNQRLKTQLKECGKMEETLSMQLSSLRDQCNLKKSSLQDNETTLDILREEVQLLTERRSELERRLATVTAENLSLTNYLEESQERIRLLERHVREQDIQIRSTSRELERLQAANSSLGEKLDAIHSLDYSRNKSLLNEMECDKDFSTFSSLEKEVVNSIETLKSICNVIRSRGISDSESSDQSMISDLSPSQLKVGMLSAVIEDLEGLVCSNGSPSPMLESEIEQEFHRCKEALVLVEKQLVEKQEELKSQAEKIMDLSGKLTIKETELRMAIEAKEIAQSDLTTASSSEEDQIKAAREARDTAIARKAELELQLAKARIEVLQANSQLIEAVQQKIELSQQLEQWQVDMQCLLDEQMKAKLTKHERKRKDAAQLNSGNSNGRRIFGFFS